MNLPSMCTMILLTIIPHTLHSADRKYSRQAADEDVRRSALQAFYVISSCAIERGSQRDLRSLFAAQQDPSFRAQALSYADENLTLLHQAAEINDPTLLRELMIYGAQRGINDQNNEQKNSPLILSVSNANRGKPYASVNLLLEKKANVSQRNKYEKDALFIAINAPVIQVPIVQRLLEAGADCNSLYTSYNKTARQMIQNRLNREADEELKIQQGCGRSCTGYLALCIYRACGFARENIDDLRAVDALMEAQNKDAKGKGAERKAKK